MMDAPDARGRTPLAWAVELGLPNTVELLQRFEAYPNQLRSTKEGGYSPLIHLNFLLDQEHRWHGSILFSCGLTVSLYWYQPFK